MDLIYLVVVVTLSEVCLGIRGISGTSIRAHSLALRLHVQCHAFLLLVSMLGFGTGLQDSIVPGEHPGGILKQVYERYCIIKLHSILYT